MIYFIRKFWFIIYLCIICFPYKAVFVSQVFVKYAIFHFKIISITDLVEKRIYECNVFSRYFIFLIYQKPGKLEKYKKVKPFNNNNNNKNMLVRNRQEIFGFYHNDAKSKCCHQNGINLLVLSPNGEKCGIIDFAFLCTNQQLS